MSPYSWVIGCQKWPFCIFYGIFIQNSRFSPMLLINKGLFVDQMKWYSTQKKRLFLMASFKFHEKNYWESSKLTNSKIASSRENHAHFISCKPPHKNHPREYFWTTFVSFKLHHQLLRNLKIYQLQFIWAPLYQLFDCFPRKDQQTSMLDLEIINNPQLVLWFEWIKV